ncbi:MAG: N-acetyltransferase [Chloroflexi bacterium]|nr:N-acetyltransferase [Chloroflexota bacterium]
MADEKTDITLRRLTVQDVPKVADLVNGYATLGQMLPRSHHKLYQFLRDFVGAWNGDQLVGCGSLALIWEQLGEIRSLAVLPEWRRKGIGKMMIDYLLEDAKNLGLNQVFALTYQQAFFESMGFRQVARESLPHKIWGDCLDCPKFPNCDETAMIINLEPHQEGEESL